MALAHRWSVGGTILCRIAGTLPKTGVKLFGLNFPNILGVAVGFDKDAAIAPVLAMLGFGHIETGTITPNPHAGNVKPRIFRLTQDEALINRMEFCGLAKSTNVANLQS